MIHYSSKFTFSPSVLKLAASNQNISTLLNETVIGVIQQIETSGYARRGVVTPIVRALCDGCSSQFVPPQTPVALLPAFSSTLLFGPYLNTYMRAEDFFVGYVRASKLCNTFLPFGMS